MVEAFLVVLRRKLDSGRAEPREGAREVGIPGKDYGKGEIK